MRRLLQPEARISRSMSSGLTYTPKSAGRSKAFMVLLPDPLGPAKIRRRGVVITTACDARLARLASKVQAVAVPVASRPARLLPAHRPHAERPCVPPSMPPNKLASPLRQRAPACVPPGAGLLLHSVLSLPPYQVTSPLYPIERSRLIDGVTNPHHFDNNRAHHGCVT